MAVREEPGWSGTFQQLLGQVVLCHGKGQRWEKNPVLYASLLRGAEGVEGAEKQTQVVVPAMSSCLLFPICTTLGKQQ